MRALRIALVQINVTVGDMEGNAERIIRAISEAEEMGADIVALPELAITGYPPEDLLLKPEFIAANLRAIAKVAERVRTAVAICGFAERRDDLFNAAALLHAGRLMASYHKVFLPTYAVFDEDRYFRAGTECPVFEIAGAAVGVSICEDIWYPDGPATRQALDGGAELLVNISASPYSMGRSEERARMLATRAADTCSFIAYANLVGGQDELVFDGQSMVFGPGGELIARAPAFQEALLIVDLDLDAAFRQRLHDPRRRKREGEGEPPRTIITARPSDGKPGLGPVKMPDPLSEEAEVYQALVTGTRDYVRKNGFQKVLIGLSGGVDSSLVACIAVDALGPEHVVGVAMPSRYTSEASRTDAQALARNLGMTLRTVSIEPAFAAYEEMLREQTRECAGTVAENLQARIRGNILMAISNAYGWLVLTTGNKSEMSTGYCTLYGDMAGGFAVIRDVPKTLVYRLAEHRNRRAGGEAIPRSVIEKPPSAELKPDQRDTDTLPPYDVLDAILRLYVEEDQPVADIVASGNDPEVVARVVHMVDASEYKRRQAPPGVRITHRALGRDRRLPITNRFRGGPASAQAA
jgi:NAD+ synthase (glutamine-hydrolysing)